MRRIRWILIIALGLFLAALVGMTMAHRSRARKALAKYKAELRAKGEKLTFEELRDEFSTNQQNTLAVLTNVVRQLAAIPLSPGAWDYSMRYSAGRVCLAWIGEGPPAYSSGGSEASDWQTISARYAEAEPALAELRIAMQHPAANEGIDSWTNIFRSTTSLVAVRNVAQWLAGATLNDLHQNQVDEALADLHALAGIANLNREEATLVFQMIRVAVGSLGLSATWQALQAAGWNERQLASLQQAWENVDFLAAIDRGWIGERAIDQELRKELRTPGQSRFRALSNSSSRLTAETVLSKYVLDPIYRATGMVDEDELFHLRIMQAGVEASRALRAGESWQKARVPMDARYAEINNLKSIDRLRYSLSLIWIPNFQKAFQTCLRNEMLRRMTITAIAVKRYELAHGKPPPTLNDLVPQFLSAVPVDLMSGQPLRYRLNADGSFVLYSIGEDGVDDGGDPNPPPGGRPGLWEGKDAVWPSPARPENEQPNHAEK